MPEMITLQKGAGEGVKDLLRSLLEDKKVSAVFTLMKDERTGAVNYSLITDPGQLKKEVVDMRERLRRKLLNTDPGVFDLRQGKGGMVDIEFLVQYLVLLHAHRFIELTEWTDNVRQIHTLALTGVISDETAHLFKEAYLTYRFALHRLSLQEQPARVPAEKFKHLREFVMDVWERFLGT